MSPVRSSRPWIAAALALGALWAPVGCAPAWSSIESLPADRPLPPIPVEGSVSRHGARLWYGVIGSGSPVILLHGGLSSHRAWGRQAPALIEAGYQVILIDSRGHGRSTLGHAPLGYDLMAEDVAAVIDHLQLDRPAIVGWSDGAVTALVLGMSRGDQLGPIYAFGANMDQKGVREGADAAPILKQAGPRLLRDYAELSPSPDFARLSQAVRAIQAGLDYGTGDLARIRAQRIRIAAGARDEFIRREHFSHLAKAIPGAGLDILPGAGHFAPWQDPDAFNRSMLAFLATARADQGTQQEPRNRPGQAASMPAPRSWSQAVVACMDPPVLRLSWNGVGWVCPGDPL